MIKPITTQLPSAQNVSFSAAAPRLAAPMEKGPPVPGTEQSQGSRLVARHVIVDGHRDLDNPPQSCMRVAAALEVRSARSDDQLKPGRGKRASDIGNDVSPDRYPGPPDQHREDCGDLDVGKARA